MKNKQVIWPSDRYFIACDSHVCAYCAESYLINFPDHVWRACDSQNCTNYNEFVGIECYKTVEDKE